MKPILFNTDMVQAILDGRKTVTRRVIKARNTEILDKPKWAKEPYWFDVIKTKNGRKVATSDQILPPYKHGDILYVRETWEKNMYGTGSPYYYKASPETYDYDPDHWRPSIHMPKEAARIFLRVTNVSVERLHDITEDGSLILMDECGRQADTPEGRFIVVLEDVTPSAERS